MLYDNCTLTIEEYKTLIYDTLIRVDFCAADHINPDVIDFYWQLQACWSMCDKELQYLLTRREVVKLLMACNVYQVDRSESVSESNSTASAKSCADGWTQSQANSHSANWSDSIAEARADTSGTTRAESQSGTTSYTEAHNASSSTSDTTGFSRSFSDSISDSFGANRSQSDGESISTKEDGGGIGTFSVSEDYVYNHSLTLGVGGSVGIAGFGRTATEGQEHTYSNSQDIDDGEEARFGHSLSNVRNSAANQSEGQSNNHSFSQAISDTFGQSTGVTDGATTARSEGESVSHSEGLSQSSAESRNRGTSSGQNTNQSHNENSATSQSNSVSTSSSYSIKYSQRFKHLATMYDNLTLLIEYKEATINRGQRVRYGQTLCLPLCDMRVEPERVCANVLAIETTMEGNLFWK